MKFCVIIPTYNRAALLRRTLDSVLAQTWGDFRVIILDNCSPDDTAAVVHSIGDPRVEYVRNERNLGSIGNWKRGLSVARDDYFILLSDDDLLAPDYLAEAAIVLDRDPSIAVYTTAVEYFTETPMGTGKILRPWWVDRAVHDWSGLPGDSIRFWLTGNPTPPCATLLRTSVMKSMEPCGGDWWPYSIDWLMAGYAASRGRFYFNNRVLSFYRTATPGGKVSEKLRGHHIRMDTFFTVDTLFGYFLANSGLTEDAIVEDILLLRSHPGTNRSQRFNIVAALAAGGKHLAAARKLVFSDTNLILRRPVCLLARLFGFWVIRAQVGYIRTKSAYPPADRQ